MSKSMIIFAELHAITFIASAYNHLVFYHTFPSLFKQSGKAFAERAVFVQTRRIFREKHEKNNHPLCHAKDGYSIPFG